MGDKPPSRERYEQENPTVSFRIAREKKEELDALVEDLETTKKDWFESIIEDGKTEVEEVREQAYEEGYQDAKEEFRLTVPCAICGEEISLRPEHRDIVYETLDRLSREGPFTATLPRGHDLEWELSHEECLEDNI